MIRKNDIYALTSLGDKTLHLYEVRKPWGETNCRVLLFLSVLYEDRNYCNGFQIINPL